MLTYSYVNGRIITIILNNAVTAYAVIGNDLYRISVKTTKEPYLFTFDYRYSINTF